MMLAFLKRYRNALLMALMMATLAVSYFVHQEQLQQASATVSLPVEQVKQAGTSRLEEFRQRRDETDMTDMAALQALCDQENLSARTREDAAAQLQALVSRREQQTALEGALSQSGVYPCVAVVEGGSVTIVTEKDGLTDGESALVITLAKAHAGVEPSGVRVMAAEGGESR